MEIKHRVVQLSNSKKFDILKKELDRLGADYAIKNLGSIKSKSLFSIEFYINEIDPLFPKFNKFIKKHDLFVHAGVYFSEQEIENAEWMYATTGEFQYPQPEDKYKEVTYDITGYCWFCGMGYTQRNPFHLKGDFKQKRSHFLGLHWEFDVIFARPLVKRIFEKEGISGIGYIHPIHYRKKEAIDTVYQLQIKETAPKGMVIKDLQTVTCKKNNEEWKFRNKKDVKRIKFCGRVKYHYPKRSPILFRKETFQNMPDIYYSHEYFGSGAGAHKLMIVSSKLRDVVLQNQLHGLRFTPIVLA